MFKIEKNVPLKNHQPANSKYPFGSMEVGDSFLAPKSAAKGAQSASLKWGKYNGVKFATRTQDDGSMRIWRVS